MLKKNHIIQTITKDIDSNFKRQNSPSNFQEKYPININLKNSNEYVLSAPNKNLIVKTNNHLKFMGAIKDFSSAKKIENDDKGPNVISDMSLKKTTSVSNSSCILNQIDPKESKKQIFDIKNKKNNPTEMIKNNLSKGLFEDSHIRNVSEEQSKQRSEAKTPVFKERGEIFNGEMIESSYFQTIVEDNLKMKEENKRNDELIKLFKEALNFKKTSISSQQEQIQFLDNKIQEILSTRKKYPSLESLHKKLAIHLPNLDETKASSSTSSHTRLGAISYKPIKGSEFQPPKTSDKKSIKDKNEDLYKPRVIRTTTPYKPNESNKLSGNKGKLNFNFNDINKFKRVEIPSKTDEKYQMNGTMKPLSKNEKIQEGSLQLPPIGNFSDEKLTFTGTFNPRKFEKTGIFKKDASPRKKQEIYTKTGYFKMGDVATVKGVFAMQANNYSAGSEGIEKFENSKQKNAGKFPKDVFATNVKRKFFV